jgi:hypothetical protein
VVEVGGMEHDHPKEEQCDGLVDTVGITGSRLEIFEKSSHMGMPNGPGGYLPSISMFLSLETKQAIILPQFGILHKLANALVARPLPTIRVPDLTKPRDSEEPGDGTPQGFELTEQEVNASQAATWNKLNEKEKLTLVLKADKEHRDLRDYL